MYVEETRDCHHDGTPGMLKWPQKLLLHLVIQHTPLFRVLYIADTKFTEQGNMNIDFQIYVIKIRGETCLWGSGDWVQFWIC